MFSSSVQDQRTSQQITYRYKNGLNKKQNHNSEFPSGLYSITDLVVKGRPERGELWVGEFVASVVKSSTDFSSKLPLSELSMSCL